MKIFFLQRYIDRILGIFIIKPHLSMRPHSSIHFPLSSYQPISFLYLPSIHNPCHPHSIFLAFNKQHYQQFLRSLAFTTSSTCALMYNLKFISTKISFTLYSFLKYRFQCLYLILHYIYHISLKLVSPSHAKIFKVWTLVKF